MEIIQNRIKKLYRNLWFSNIIYKSSFGLIKRIDIRDVIEEIRVILKKYPFDSESLKYYKQIKKT